jgi:pimeloyl-ACP methyl ester carboxylesterase
MGGMIAQHVAMAVPHRLRALVLMDTGHGTVGVDRDLAAWGASIAREEGMDALADVLNSIESPLDTPAHQRLLEENPEHKAFDERKLRASSPAMYAAMASALTAEHDRLELLAALAVPTLVLVGDQDEPFVGPSERLAETIPTAELVVIPDAGHSPQFEQPMAWERALFRFLEDQVAPPRRRASA